MTPAPGSNKQKELEVLLAGLVEAGLSAEQKSRLSELLRDDTEARLFYKRYIELHAMLEWEAGTVATQRPESDALQDLLRMESEAQAELVHDIGRLHNRNRTQMQAFGALRWVINNPAAWGGLAAVLAIALILTVVFGGGNPTQPTPNTPTAQQPGTSHNTPTVVATLTTQHDAVWAGRALAYGSELKAGDRLTLTTGFAEITTHSGAVVIIEAPATVELLDNNNAIRLHTGKLVGTCETESSKGFVVRSPHMDITDLGTRFGVDATQEQKTTVHVIEGEVEVVHTSDQGSLKQPHRIVAGQALVGSEAALTESSYQPQPFAYAFEGLSPSFEGGPVVWQGMVPGDLLLNQQEADALQVFLERRSQQLPEDMPVDMLPGEAWPPKRGLGKATVPNGSTVDVYLLHLDPVGEQIDREVRVNCVIRFDRPVLGLIGAQSTLRETDAGLGLTGASYPSIKGKSLDVATGGAAGLEMTHLEDTAVLSADGLTLTLNITAVSLDQLRVIVATENAQAP